MTTSILNINLLIDLIKTCCVVMVFAYVFTRTKFFINILDRKFTVRSQLIIIVLFGALSIFGTYGGITMPSGAIANIRDLGPMVAGLLGGPITGIGAGLIGGIHRYFMGGFVCVPCSLATVIAGLLGGIVFLINKKELAPIWQAAILAVFQECLHMGLTLWLATPFENALAVVKEVVIPMIVANALGISIFGFIVHNLINERKTQAEKERLRHKLERTEYEMKTARAIQASFLPEASPVLDNYELAALSIPASQVGGDFYDFIPLGKNKWGIVIADVSGKGVPAALFMALSRTLVRADTNGELSAADAIQKANHHITETSRFGMFVTLFYGVLDLNKKVFQYVNAGHNPPLLLGQNHHDITMLKAKGIALGVLDDINFEQKEIPLNGDDMLVLYTDGITEAVNGSNEQFGQERLSKIIHDNGSMKAQELVDTIKHTVFDFAIGQPQHDDFTVVVLKSANTLKERGKLG
jgi:phosphoserine phosphatase RsbU/P